ncbi:uncharacterized protein LOC114719377 [Neltuma alba]|uniref:uncharacterized protein LOC114719377 n=1 Tax=Neltuma alba TaxID=207710 RepID=UPI0010A43504|nr:uncharacterized protein LOC114719377 [Prosopis alba]
MEEMQTLDIDKTAITELPSSICNLIGLEILHVEECRNLAQLPASICTLPNLWKLRANSCEGMSHFKMCEGGECIKEYHNLKYLLLDNCDKLEHIGGMPPDLEKFSAIRCTSLTKLSKNKVMEPAMNFRSGKRNFILPGEKFPEGLHNYSRENFVSFWVRNMFPMTFLWILVKDNQDDVYSCQFSVDIDEAIRLGISSMWSSLSPIKTNHIYICDMQSMIHNTELPITNEWSQGKVSIQSTTQETEGEKEIYLGVHVYYLQSNLENIQFVEPGDYSTKEMCIMHGFGSYQDLEILEDGGYRGITYPIWSGDRCYDNLIKLRLTDCNRCRRIPALGELPSLRSLRIERLQSVVTVGSEFYKAANDCASLIVPFPSLETLHFEEGLEIMSRPLLASSIPKCPNIHQLAIIKSPNVMLQEQELPPSLRGLAISGGRMLEPLSEKLHIEDLTVDCSDALPPAVIHIPASVKQLEVRNCENLKDFLV